MLWRVVFLFVALMLCLFACNSSWRIRIVIAIMIADVQRTHKRPPAALAWVDQVRRSVLGLLPLIDARRQGLTGVWNSGMLDV